MILNYKCAVFNLDKIVIKTLRKNYDCKNIYYDQSLQKNRVMADIDC